MTTAIPLLFAMALDACFGEPDWLWSRFRHPAVVMGKGVSMLERYLNQGAARRLKGILAVLVLSVTAIVTGWVISLFGPIAEALTAAILLAQKSLVQHVMAVARGLRLSDRDGQVAVSMIVSRDTAGMSQAQSARSALESASENLSDGIIAPAFWFLLAGAPGIIFYKAINTADSMIGYRTERYESFGWAAARLDDVLNLIPARLTALLIAFPQGLREWRGIVSDAHRHKSPNAGWPEAAMARRLGVALAGPRVYDGQLRDFPWVNDGAKIEIGPKEIEAGVAILWSVWWRAMILTLAIALI
ncbi:MAG: adenosylcobinamide-phosphate synthase CbiB [Paracoccaceae bacterium]